MRRRSGSLHLTAPWCGVAVIGAALGLALIWALAWSTHAATPQDRVSAAYAAMGGDKLKTISLTAHIEQFEKYTDDDIHNLMAYLQTLR